MDDSGHGLPSYEPPGRFEDTKRGSPLDYCWLEYQEEGLNKYSRW
jgi:hypothetical protein